MAKFDGGIKFYTTGKAEVTVHFPKNEVKCQYCPFMKWNNELHRGLCIITNRMIYSYLLIQEDCPLKFEKNGGLHKWEEQ